MTIEAKLGGALYGTGSNQVYFRCISYDSAGDTFNDTITGANSVYIGFTPVETTYLTLNYGPTSKTDVTNTQS